MADFTLGLNAKLYRASNAFTGSEDTDVDNASLTEMTNVMDVSFSGSTGTAGVTTRGSGGWRQEAATLREAEITFSMLQDSADDDYLAIVNAWLGNAEVGLAMLNGNISGGTVDGVASNFMVTSLSRDESLEEAIKVDITLRASSQTQWYGSGFSG